MLGYKEQIKWPLKHTRRHKEVCIKYAIKVSDIIAIKKLFEKLFATLITWARIKEYIERRHGEPFKFLFLPKMGLLGSQAVLEKKGQF